MLPLGSFTSQVLQWTQFWALMTKRGRPPPPPIHRPGRAISVGRTGIDVVLGRLLQVHVGDLEMNRAGPLRDWCWKGTPTIVVKGELAVRLRRRDGMCAFAGSSVLPSAWHATAFRTARNRACCTTYRCHRGYAYNVPNFDHSGLTLRTPVQILARPPNRATHSHNRPVRSLARPERARP